MRISEEEQKLKNQQRRLKRIEKLKKAIEKEEEEERIRYQMLVRRRTNVRHSFYFERMTRQIRNMFSNLYG